MGTTLGMMIANVPAVWVGETLAHRVNMKRMRWVAAALFFLLGGLTLLASDDAVRVSAAPTGECAMAHGNGRSCCGMDGSPGA
jgi:hypothetical protein